jgi:hypothetical protein
MKIGEQNFPSNVIQVSCSNLKPPFAKDFQDFCEISRLDATQQPNDNLNRIDGGKLNTL